MVGRRVRRRATAAPVAKRRRRGADDASVATVFSKRLAQTRRRAGLTQVQLAAALDRDRSLISHLERGHIGKMADIVRNVARELGVSADYLLGLTDDPVCDLCHMRDLHAELRSILGDSNGKIERLNEALTLLLARMGK